MSLSFTVSPSTTTLVRSEAAEAGMAAPKAAAVASKKARRCVFTAVFRLVDVVQGLEHLVRGLDDLGVHLVRALGADQVRDLLDRVHVRAFEEPLQDRAKALVAGRADHGVSGGLR